MSKPETVDLKKQLVKGGETAYVTATKVLTGFRDFVLRGNVVDLAVAIVIGTAFTAVVKALVSTASNQAS